MKSWFCLTSLFLLIIKSHALASMELFYPNYPMDSSGALLAVEDSPDNWLLSLPDGYTISNVLFAWDGLIDQNGVVQTTSKSFGVIYGVDVNTGYYSIKPITTLKKGWYCELLIVLDVDSSGGLTGSDEVIDLFMQVVMDPSLQNTYYSLNALDGGKTKLTIPAGAIPSGVDVAPAPPTAVSAQNVSAATTKLQDIFGGFAQPITLREFVAKDKNGSSFTSQFNKSVTIEIPYSDSDQDGFVDGVSPKIKETQIVVFYLDESRNLWVKVSNGTVDTTNNKVTFQASHLSKYALFGNSDIDVHGVYAYPVPFKSASGHKKITFTNLPNEGTIRIFTSNGELVRKIALSLTAGSRSTDWDVKDEDGVDLGSDVYLYVVESGPNIKKGKVVIVR